MKTRGKWSLQCGQSIWRPECGRYQSVEHFLEEAGMRRQDLAQIRSTAVWRRHLPRGSMPWRQRQHAPATSQRCGTPHRTTCLCRYRTTRGGWSVRDIGSKAVRAPKPSLHITGLRVLHDFAGNFTDDLQRIRGFSFYKRKG